jgi:hypothetical protein
VQPLDIIDLQHVPQPEQVNIDVCDFRGAVKFQTSDLSPTFTHVIEGGPLQSAFLAVQSSTGCSLSLGTEDCRIEAPQQTLAEGGGGGVLLRRRR